MKLLFFSSFSKVSKLAILQEVFGIVTGMRLALFVLSCKSKAEDSSVLNSLIPSPIVSIVHHMLRSIFYAALCILLRVNLL